jgi:hypothetical protein
LKAPPLVAEYSEGGFDCLISDVGMVTADPRPDAETMDDLLEHYWSLDPGAQLTKAFSTSHQLLGERLVEKLVAKAGVAIDSDDEAETLAAFQRRLPRVRRLLRTMPLYVFNPHLDPGQVYLRAGGQGVVTSWGRWSLEPIGVVLPEDDTEEALVSRLERVRQARSSLPDDFGVGHLRLAADGFFLERQLERGHFKRALATMAELLASPLLAESALALPAVERPRGRQAKPGTAPKSRRRGAEARRDRGLPLAVEGES